VAKRVRIRDDARADIAELEAYYADISPELVEDLRAELAQAFTLIAEQPTFFAWSFADVRRVLVRRFHVGIFFHESETDADENIVIGVHDLRRHPRTWQRRR
jgi:plasmid stabilization system protein ParE